MNLTPLILMNIILVILTVVLTIARKTLVDYGECSIVINKEKTIQVQGGDSLLNSFTANSIFIPSACGGKATCGHCKVKVLTGAGPILPTEEIYIDKEEKDSGIRLACQVKIKNDIEVYIPEYLLDTREYKVTVEKIEDLTHDIKYIAIKLDGSEKMEFYPGQYVQIKIPGTDEFRAYSIASLPSKNDGLELLIRLVPGGLCSSYVHFVLEEGNKLIISGPFGDFYLHEDSNKDIICIGGGCGMAPIRSIVYHLAEKNMPRKITYFFGARTKKDLFYTEEFEELESRFPNFKYIPVLSEPKATDKWQGEKGFVTQVVEKYVEDGSIMEAYLCGPPPMIDAAISVLTKNEMTEEDIYYDKF